MKQILLTITIVLMVFVAIPANAFAIAAISGDEIALITENTIIYETVEVWLPGLLTPIVIVVPRDEQASWGEIKVIYSRSKND